MKHFCIIAVDYEKSVKRLGNPSLSAGLLSLKNQTFKDFWIVLCHDGPKSIYYDEEGIELSKNIIVINTTTHNNCWGHHSRNFAMQYAYEQNLGKYYLQFNVDNILYDNALEALSKINKPIIIFEILHWKISHKEAHQKKWKILENGGVVVTGYPAKPGRIDCLQLVATKDVWKANGFWNNYTYMGDGIIYEKLCKENSCEYINIILGENF